MDTATSQRTVKGLDIGTSRIVLATLNGQMVNFTPQLNAFVDIPYSKMTEQMLARENILHQVEQAAVSTPTGIAPMNSRNSSKATRVGRCKAAC